MSSRRPIISHTPDDSLDEDAIAELLGSDIEDNNNNTTNNQKKISTANLSAGLANSYIPRAQRQLSNTNKTLTTAQTRPAAVATATKSQYSSSHNNPIDDEFNLSGLNIKTTLPTGKNSKPGVIPARKTATNTSTENEEESNYPQPLPPAASSRPTTATLTRASTTPTHNNKKQNTTTTTAYLPVSDEQNNNNNNNIPISPVSASSADSRPSSAGAAGNAEDINERRARYREMKAKRAANKSRDLNNSNSKDPFAELDDPLAEIETTQQHQQQQKSQQSAYENTASSSATTQPRIRRNLSATAATNNNPNTTTATTTTSSNLTSPTVDRSYTPLPSIPTLEKWHEWLNLDSKSLEDRHFLNIAKRAHSSRLPSYYKFQGGLYINQKTGEKYDQHPAIKYWKKKIEEKRFQLRFGVMEDNDGEGEEGKTLNESDLESSEEENNKSPSSTSRTLQNYRNNLNNQNPLSPKTNKLQTNNNTANNTGNNNNNNNVTTSTSIVSASSSALPPRPNPSTNPSTTAAAIIPSTAATSSANILTFPTPDTTRPPTSYTGVYSDSSIERELEARQQRITQLQQQTTINKLNTPNIHLNSLSIQDSPELLLNTIRQQQNRIIELESKQSNLLLELENSHHSVSNLLLEQRRRLQSQFDEQFQRLELEYSSKKRQFERNEANLQEELRDLKAELQLFELKKQQSITEAVQLSENRHKESLEHAIRLHSLTLQQQQSHYQRELDQLKQLHHSEINTIREQFNSSALINNLAHSLEHNTNNLNHLQRSLNQELKLKEANLSEQLTAREKLIREKEEQLEIDKKHNQQLVITFERLMKENEVEKQKFERELYRLTELQADLKQETVLLRENITAERENLSREKNAFEVERNQFKQMKQRIETELEMKKDSLERANLDAIKQLEEIREERNRMFEAIDQEREELKTEKREFLVRKQRLEEEEELFKKDEAELQENQLILEKKMAELTELGKKLKEKSESVAKLYTEIKTERELNEKLVVELQEKQFQTNLTTQKIEEEQKKLESKKIGLLKEQKRFLTEKHSQNRIPSYNNYQGEMKMLEAGGGGNENYYDEFLGESIPARYNNNNKIYATSSSGAINSVPIRSSSHAQLRRALMDLIANSADTQQFISSKFGLSTNQNKNFSSTTIELDDSEFHSSPAQQEQKYNHHNHNNPVSSSEELASESL